MEGLAGALVAATPAEHSVADGTRERERERRRENERERERERDRERGSACVRVRAASRERASLLCPPRVSRGKRKRRRPTEKKANTQWPAASNGGHPATMQRLLARVHRAADRPGRHHGRPRPRRATVGGQNGQGPPRLHQLVLGAPPRRPPIGARRPHRPAQWIWEPRTGTPTWPAAVLYAQVEHPLRALRWLATTTVDNRWSAPLFSRSNLPAALGSNHWFRFPFVLCGIPALIKVTVVDAVDAPRCGFLLWPGFFPFFSFFVVPYGSESFVCGSPDRASRSAILSLRSILSELQPSRLRSYIFAAEGSDDVTMGPGLNAFPKNVSLFCFFFFGGGGGGGFWGCPRCHSSGCAIAERERKRVWERGSSSCVRDQSIDQGNRHRERERRATSAERWPTLISALLFLSGTDLVQSWYENQLVGKTLTRLSYTDNGVERGEARANQYPHILEKKKWPWKNL